MFALHTYAPYVRQCQSFGSDMGTAPGDGLGYPTYISNLCKSYPDDYEGPFTLGAWWQDLAQQSV